uniref:Uncharacterized protein n=1 Tax=Loa loa TaxID=7209 RepID=A0A1I7VMM6_LOALO
MPERLDGYLDGYQEFSSDEKEGEEGSWNIERPTDVFIAAAAAAAAGGGGGLKCFGTDHFDFPGIAAAYWRNSQTKKL